MKAVLQYRASPGLRQRIAKLDFTTVIVKEADKSAFLREMALPNVVVTPHLAWLTTETLERSLVVIAENCRRLRTGEALLHRVV